MHIKPTYIPEHSNHTHIKPTYRVEHSEHVLISIRLLVQYRGGVNIHFRFQEVYSDLSIIDERKWRNHQVRSLGMI